VDELLRGASVLITGGTGFLGSHLTRQLMRQGARPHLVARPESSFHRLADVHPAPDSTLLELGDADALGACVGRVRPDIVFHLAGTTAGRRSGAQSDTPAAVRSRSYEVNLTGTLRVLEAVMREAPAARVIRTGGLAEYGMAPVPFHEDQREQPASAYAASQVAATHLGQAFAREHGVSVTTIRPALVYGPAQSESFFIPSLIAASLEGRPYEMSSGEQTRDLIFVDDAVDALIRAASATGLSGVVINAGSGREYRIRDVAELIVAQTGGHTVLRHGRAPGDSGDLQRLFCDCERARRLLGWTAVTALDDGLGRTIAWYRARG
jgi:nucleoside-diphosphate-sugar epimerase